MCCRLLWIVCVRMRVCASVGSVLGNVSRVMQSVSHSLPSSAQRTESHNHEARPWTDSWNVKLPRPTLPTPTYWEHTQMLNSPSPFPHPRQCREEQQQEGGRKGDSKEMSYRWEEQLINKLSSGSGPFLGKDTNGIALLNSLGSSFLKNFKIQLLFLCNLVSLSLILQLCLESRTDYKKQQADSVQSDTSKWNREKKNTLM